MTWQDAVVAVGQALFAAALIPAVLGAQKPPRSTCALTGFTLLAFAAAYGSLALWWSAGVASICGALWLTLLWQQRPRFGVDPAVPGGDRTAMTHVGCGGEVVEDPRKSYSYEGCSVPAYRCERCGEEILGDAQLHVPGYDA